MSANGRGAEEVVSRKIWSGRNPRVIVGNVPSEQHIRTQEAGNRKGRQEGIWNLKIDEIGRGNPVHHNIRYLSRTGLCSAYIAHRATLRTIPSPLCLDRESECQKAEAYGK